MRKIIMSLMFTASVMAFAVQMIDVAGAKFPILNLQGNPPPGWQNNSLAMVNWIFVPGGSSIPTVSETHYMAFDGVDEYITMSNNTKVYGATDYTALCYSKAVAGTDQVMFGQWDTVTPARSWSMGQSNTSGLLRVFVSADNAATAFKNYSSTSAQYDNTWKQYAFVHDSGALTLYVDGASVTVTKTSDGTVDPINSGSSATSFRIGAQNSATPRYFNGAINYCAIWNSALAANELLEIDSNYNPGSSGTALDLTQDYGNYVSSASLQYWARLGEGDSTSASGVLDSSGVSPALNGSMTNMESGDITAF